MKPTRDLHGRRLWLMGHTPQGEPEPLPPGARRGWLLAAAGGDSHSTQSSTV